MVRTAHKTVSDYNSQITVIMMNLTYITHIGKLSLKPGSSLYQLNIRITESATI